jgi:hypothetical protein
MGELKDSNMSRKRLLLIKVSNECDGKEIERRKEGEEI